ncbi:MAG: Ig domain-containing protein [bacterium]
MAKLKKQREINIVSLSFLDVLSNTIGALAFLLLLLVIATTIVTAKMHYLSLEIVTDTNLPDAKEGEPYSIAISAIGGDEPYLWQYQGELPEGVKFDNKRGIISGIPKVNPIKHEKTFIFTVQVSDSYKDKKSTVQKELKIKVFPLPPITWEELKLNPVKIKTDTLPNAMVGSYYKIALSAIGGLEPYRWLINGDLPAGLRLSNDLILGTPKMKGTSTFILKVIDVLSKSDEKEVSLRIEPAPIKDFSDGSDSKSLSFIVDPKLTVLPLKITTKKLSGAIVDIPYQITLAASGGIVPYKWLIVKGKLPKGLKLDEEKGEINGILKDTEEGMKYKFLLEVEDSQGVPAKDSKWLNIATYFAKQPEKFWRKPWVIVLATIGIILIIYYIIALVQSIIMKKRGYELRWVKLR